MRIVMTTALFALSGCGDMWVEASATTCGGGGVWEDTSTGYTWQNPGASDTYAWGKAKLYCEGLTCSDHSDWHLPTIGELETILTADDASGCYWKDGLTGECSWYWSSLAYEGGSGDAWGVDFNFGNVNDGYYRDGDYHVRCVR